ncbi:MAG: hypothetical protein M9936_02495 [Caldilinea sp.]|nr:hypothetical protein [Caldilineaceae bacterium]MCO5208536.1 hypothetical protein [Caldilinea sp.]
MAWTISSSEPSRLSDYASQMVEVDKALIIQASQLRSVLLSYESSCSEPGFSVRVSYLVDGVNQHSNTCHPIDLWVGLVSLGFLRADSSEYGGTRIANIYGQFSSGENLIWADNWPLFALIGAGMATSDVGKGSSDALFWDALKKGSFGDLYEAGEAISDVYHVGGLNPTSGFSYVGQVNLHGGGDLKAAYGWSRNLSHMRFDMTYANNIVKLSGQSGLHEARESILPSTKLGLAFTAIELTFIGVENWGEYHDDGLTKVAAGTVVDSAITIGLTAAGAGVGAAAGGVVLGAALGALTGGTLAPVGVAVGSKVGGLVGSWAGGWLADQVLSTEADEWLTDQLDAGIDEAAALIADQTQTAVKGTLEIVDNIAGTAEAMLATKGEQVEDAFMSAVGSVVGLF